MSDTATTGIPARGDRFPDLPVTLSNGVGAQLSAELPDGRAVVVFFLRSSDCPVCRAHVRTLQRMADAGELAGAGVVLVVPGDAADAAAVQRRTTFPVLASGDGHRAVGLGRFLMMQHSGTFVLDAERRVLAARASALPTASFSRAEIRAALS